MNRKLLQNGDDEFVRNPGEQEAEPEPDDRQPCQLPDTGSMLFAHKDKIIHCLTIIGQVEGHYLLSDRSKTTKYEHILPLLVSIAQDERIDGLLILLNTVGGDVEAGLAIAEVISGLRKPTVSIVLGGGQSASMTVHPVRTTGLTLGVPQTFEYFRRMQDRITNFVVENSGITPERYSELVLNTGELVTDVGTILDGEDAVREGLIDSVGTVSDAIDALYELIINQ